MEPPNKGHIGDNINSAVLSFIERSSSFRGSKTIGHVIFATSNSVLWERKRERDPTGSVDTGRSAPRDYLCQHIVSAIICTASVRRTIAEREQAPGGGVQTSNFVCVGNLYMPTSQINS